VNEEGIILNELPLTEAFIPTRLLHREGQLKEIERCLKPALRNRNIENVFLVGPSGTGKTLLAKWILETHFIEISVYVSCWDYRHTHEVLREILVRLGKPIHGREPTGDLVKLLQKVLEKRKIIVCLDEVDQLKEFNVLYTLLRNGCGLILISNHYHALMHLDGRISSSLALTEINFPLYTKDEIYDIAKDRVQFAFRPGAIKDDLTRIISAMANGDARIALQILLRAAKKAEDKNLKHITIEEIKQASKEAHKFKKSYLLKKLNEHQRVIYEILERKIKMASGALYKEYRSLVSKPVVDRAYRNYMKRMVELGLVKVEGKGRWKIFEIVM